jgi:NodT family efflux transporter outer membrane factor (OMF) lipoprotein
VKGALPISLAVLALLGGCALGPDYHPPAAPKAAGYTAAALRDPAAVPGVTGGGAQRFVAGRDIPAQWWRLFHSPTLDRLIAEALAANPDLKAARASLRQARELALAQGGTLYPSATGSFSDTRERVNDAVGGKPDLSQYLSLANASVSVGYVLDVFGGQRRAVEAAQAAAEVKRYQAEAAYLSLTANLATAVIQEAGLRSQIKATRAIIAAETIQLRTVRRQYALGAAASGAVLAQQGVLAASRATLPPLERQRAQLRHQIAALTGRLPGSQKPLGLTLADLTLPADLPVSLPSRLVRQRPDIAAAAAQLHAADADLGVAIANQFPQFTISAGFGRNATDPGGLIQPAATVWSLTGGLTQSLFDAGQLHHKRQAASAAVEAAAAQYRSTVLTAFRNVADALRAIDTDAALLREQAAADRFAADRLQLVQSQYRLGAVSNLTLLDAERTYEQAHIGLVQAETARFADTAALFQALGGGWWNRAAAPTKGVSAP